MTERTKFVKDWKTFSSDGDFYVHGIFQAMPTLFAENSEEKGGNMLGLDRETDNGVLFQIQMMVKGEDQEMEARKRLQKFFKDIKEHQVEVGGDIDWQYLNYADSTQNPLPSYGEENVAYLKKVAKKYDPLGVFQKRMPGGFKISEV